MPAIPQFSPRRGPDRVGAVKRLRGAPALTLRSLRDDRAVAIGRFVSKASTPKSRRVAPVFGVEALAAQSLSRAQRSSLAEGVARQRAWA
jgi:hypothetical protein